MKIIIAISAILIIAIIALAFKVDGVLLASAMSLIAGLGGYSLGKGKKS